MSQVTEKVSVRLPVELADWLRSQVDAATARKEKTDLSDQVCRAIMTRRIALMPPDERKEVIERAKKLLPYEKRKEKVKENEQEQGELFG